MEDELFINKSKHRVLKLIITILVIALITGGAYYYYVNFLDNPTKTITTTLSKASSKMQENIVKSKELTKLKYNGLVSFQLDLGDQYKDITELLNNLTVQVEGKADTKEEIVQVNLNTKYKEDKLLNLKGVIQDKDYFIYLEDLYDKYLKIPVEETEEEKKTYTQDDVATITTKLMDALSEELAKKEIKTKDEEIVIKEKKYQVVNHYLELNSQELNAILINVKNKLENDSAFKKAYKNITGYDIETADDNDIGTTSDEGKYIFNFYYEGNLKKELRAFKYSFVEKESEGNITINLLDQDEFQIIMTMEEGTVTANIKLNDQVFNLDFNFNGMEMQINVKANFNFEEIGALEKIEIKDYKKIEELTEEEQQEIYANMEKNKTLVDFFNEIEGLIISYTEV